MTKQPLPAHKRPAGIYVIALLIFLVGAVWLLAALVLPFTDATAAPWYVYLGAAAYFLILGWGVWGARRWAYFAALLMCLVVGFYALQTALLLERNALLLLLAPVGIFGYLLRPRIRAEFLQTVKRET
jgi:hypothetical protein